MSGLAFSRSLAQQKKRRLSAGANLQLNQPALAMQQTLEKQLILPVSDLSRTAHLQPVIDFLKAGGNTPATGDAFYYDRDGYGVYGFAQPLDVEGLREKFDFPPDIQLSKNTVFDAANFVTITQDSGPKSGRVINFNV